MSKEKKSHFWIPEEEVLRETKTPKGRTKPQNRSYSDHGSKLSHGLQSVKVALKNTATDNSLADLDMLVFHVELPEGEKVQDRKELFDANGMRVRAVKTVRSAIVTSTQSQFQTLNRRVNTYTQDGSLKTHFDFIESFNPYIGQEKDSSELRKALRRDKPPATLDVQLMLIPNLEREMYASALAKLIDKIKHTEGEIQESPYYLSDNTPVIRAIISSSALPHFENDQAIYRIEETDFFHVDVTHDSAEDLGQLTLDVNVNLDELPIVAILDSGVSFPVNFRDLVVRQWVASESHGGDCEHGTKVASRVAFKYISQQLPSETIIPRARIIDCNILDGSVPVNVFIQRIQAAVAEFSDVTKVYNLSANANSPIEGDEMSIVGYELDALQLKKKVQFFVSAGNHSLWQTESSLEEIMDDDDSRIAPPADSMLSVCVGAVVGADYEKSLSSKNQIAPYSRRGAGFTGLSKPDLTAYTGTTIWDDCVATVPRDVFSLLLTKAGTLMPDSGTSFSTPVVTGDYAEILNALPDNDILLAKALLYHNAMPLWDDENMDDEELASVHNQLGRGLSNVDDSKFSSPSKVTFVRTGALNRTTKERVKVYMPPILAAQVGRNVAKVSVTCLSLPPVDRTKGTEYLGAYIRASLKKPHPDNDSLIRVDPNNKEGRRKWDICHQFSKLFSDFRAGDWQVWLELFSRWDERDDDVPYALVVTIEDVSETLDIYSEIEALNRYRVLNTIRIRVSNKLF